MLFSLKKIAALASRQAYLRGVNLYGAGAVSELSWQEDAVFASRLVATVTDRAADAAYPVEVGFDAAGEAVHYHCPCAARESGACKHVVAALTHQYYRDMVADMPSAPPMAGVARRMLDSYLRDARHTIAAAATPAAALLPTLHLGTPPTLSFCVRQGGGHPYVIKDIAKFCGRLAAGESAAYGELTLLHHPAAFDVGSHPLLSLLAATVAPPHSRTLPLTPALLDRFFSLYAGQAVSVDGVSRTLLEYDPPLPLSVEATGDGATLIGDAPAFAVGTRRLYLPHGDNLCATSPAFCTATRALLSALKESGGRLRLSQKELSEFVGGVLPAITPFSEFSGDVECFDPHRPLPLTAEIFVDLPAPTLATARVEFRYGERVVSPADNDDTVRDRLGEWRILSAIAAVFSGRGEGGIFSLACDDDTLYALLADGLPALTRLGAVYMSDAFSAVRLAPPPRVSVGVSLSSGLLDLEIDTGELSRAELAALLESYRARKRYHRLRSGEFLSLSDPALLALSRLGEGLGLSPRRLQSGRIQVPAFRAPFVERVLTENRALGYTRDAATRALLKAVGAVEHGEYNPPATLVGALRDYQRVGFRWLRTMEEFGFGGILADDMGLGKTVQMIALFLDAAERGVTLPSLVVCPASLVLGWESELRRFAPSLTVRAVIGDSATRADILSSVRGGEILVTSYDLLRRDAALYEPLSFHYHVLDEAQYIKNHTTRNARTVKAIRSVQRFALTGTPIENRLSELWSIFDFLMPNFLFSYPRFRERFELPAVRDGDAEATAALQRMCAPFILRRLKRDVLRELPPKTETVLTVPLSDLQRKTYLAAAIEMKEQLAANPAHTTRLQALTMLTRLRQLCCDPSLCYENWRGTSAKLESCMELVSQAVAGGHRVLLFSQFTSMLAILQERLAAAGIPFFTLQGATPKEKRAAMVTAFNDGSGPPVFLISLKAGGTGLNLTAADVVIHYDPWWNLSVQNQATDRAHRIGQQKPVQVYKLIAQDTVEEKILKLQEKKQSLADAVVAENTAALSSLSEEELLALLMG